MKLFSVLSAIFLMGAGIVSAQYGVPNLTLRLDGLEASLGSNWWTWPAEGPVDFDGNNAVDIGDANFVGTVDMAETLNINGYLSVSNSEYRAYSLTSAPTVTVTRAMGNLVTLYCTNTVNSFTFATGEWDTNRYGLVNLQLFTGGKSIAFPTNVISGADLLNISTNMMNTLLFERKRHQNIWRVTQPD